MKKQKVMLIKDFHNENGTLHAGEKVTVKEDGTDICCSISYFKRNCLTFNYFLCNLMYEESNKL